MIKSSELRVGNYIKKWVAGSQVILPVESSDFADIEKLETGEPIPITEQWLLKFGFNRQSSNHFLIFHNNKLLFSIYNGSLVIEGAYMPLDLKYVHQIQNIYHSLTGKELEIS